MKNLTWIMAMPVVCVAGGCCLTPPKTPSSANVHEVIDQVKDELRAFYDTPVVLKQKAPPGARCKSADGQDLVRIKPKSIKLTLKTVGTYENDPSVGLVAPLGVLAIDPSYTGAYSRSNAQSLEIDLDPKPFEAPKGEPILLAKSTNGPKRSDHPLYSIIVSMASELLAVDHTKLPCVQPTDAKSTIYFDVVNKSTGGITLQVVGFKLGDKVTVTDEFHQQLEFDFTLEGSPLLMEQTR
jgi:hypothetical protein